MFVEPVYIHVRGHGMYVCTWIWMAFPTLTNHCFTTFRVHVNYHSRCTVYFQSGECMWYLGTRLTFTYHSSLVFYMNFSIHVEYVIKILYTCFINSLARSGNVPSAALKPPYLGIFSITSEQVELSISLTCVFVYVKCLSYEHFFITVSITNSMEGVVVQSHAIFIIADDIFGAIRISQSLKSDWPALRSQGTT